MMSYSPVGDLTVVSVCLVMIVLMYFSYIRNTRTFKVFLSLVGLLIAAACSGVAFHLLTGMPQHHGVAYVLRCVYHAVLFLIFVLFVVYITEATRMKRKKKIPFVAGAGAIFLVVVVTDVVNMFRGKSLRITPNGVEMHGPNVFVIGYVVFIVLLLIMLASVRNKLYKRVMMGFYGSIGISFVILVIQAAHGQTSFTVATFLYPVIAMFYSMHSNPYDAQLGTIDSKALEDTVRYNYEINREFVFMSLYLRSFDEEGKMLPEELQALVRRYSSDFFKEALMFQAGKGHEILLFTKKRNPGYEEKIKEILKSFDGEYEKYKIDYKIVIGQSIDDISRKNEYVSFIRSIHRKMDENTVHWIGEEDVKQFNRTEYILNELGDIYRKKDLSDPRVLAFCQPVYNIKTERYDTAEALMRLKLDDLGMVFPDEFIPLAEENGYIHILTEIILAKTCEEIRVLTESGYQLSRISVNVSALELKYEQFCEDINRIIDKSGIPGEKIAIELTETQTESDFLVMKTKISELKKRGIKFYLDDFGTGYSNMERIMELPFDIIKFDRSLVLACGSSERSKKIVIGLANLFAEMQYSVLYEGVEKDTDEQMCINMSASYLQGYKYSRPVPIPELKDFLTS